MKDFETIEPHSSLISLNKQVTSFQLGLSMYILSLLVIFSMEIRNYLSCVISQLFHFMNIIKIRVYPKQD